MGNLAEPSDGLEPSTPSLPSRRCRELLHPIAKRLQRDTFRTRLFAVDGDDSPPPVSISFPGTTSKLVVFACRDLTSRTGCTMRSLQPLTPPTRNY